MLQIKRKRIKKIHASYTVEETVLEIVNSIKYHKWFEMEYKYQQ